MKPLWSLLLLLLIPSYCVYAQQEGTDTLEVHSVAPPAVRQESPLGRVIETPPTEPIASPDTTPLRFRPIIYTPVIPGQAPIINWHNGAIFAEGQSTLLPGLMSMDEGRLTFYQQWGDFSWQAYGAAAHYAFDRGLATQWGFGGSLSYQMTEQIGWTAFGAYHTAAGLLPPAVMGYVRTPTFGGFMDYRFGATRAGVKVGAQSYYDPLRRQWETQPIVMPYYHNVGIDLGGILYQVIKMNTSHPSKHSGNPTIFPTKVQPVIPPHP